MAFKYHLLVVANRTADSHELLEAMRAHAESRATEFTLLVPAQQPGPAGREAAQETLDRALKHMRDAGLEVEGETGPADPAAAVQELWDPKRFDEVIVSTLPTQASKWLQIDLPHIVARLTGVQVTHVLSTERKKAGTTGPPPEHEKASLGALSVLAWGGPSEKQAGPRPERREEPADRS